MRIVQFEASGLHGYLQFDILFHHRLTFLTGINGSGKTTALNSMIALISADLAMLADLKYDYISVDIEDGKTQITIWATSDEVSVSLYVSGIEPPFTFARYAVDPDLPAYRQSEGETEYYRELAQTKAQHPVLKALASIPNPMFLGIDRRSTLGLGRPALSMGRQNRFGRNIFNRSLSSSLTLAMNLAERRCKDALIQAGRLAGRLQREMLLGLLGSGADDISTQLTLKLPTPDDVRELRRVRSDRRSIAAIMNLPLDEVEQRLLPLLDELQSLADQIGQNTNVEQALRSNNRDTKLLEAVARWSANQSHLIRIRFISEKIASYNELRKQILAPVIRPAILTL